MQEHTTDTGPTEFTYNINSVTTINLDDYTFNDPIIEQDVLTEAPAPSELRHSTRTITAMLYQDNIDWNFWVTSLERYNTILDSIPGWVDANTHETTICHSELYWIILNRLHKDKIEPDVYFKELLKKTRSGYTRLIASNILVNLSKCYFINHEELFKTIEFKPMNPSEFWVSSILVRDLKPRSALPDFVGKKTRGFRNQVTCRIIKTIDSVVRNINVMIFQNGKLTITGCKCSDEVTDVIEFIKDLITENSKRNRNIMNDPDSKLLHDDIKCHSMNYHFSLGFSIDNNNLYKLLNSDEYSDNFDMLSYDTTDFSGLKFRLKQDSERNFKGALCIIFKTGSINIYRSSSEEEVMYVYNTINMWASKHFSEIYRAETSV